MVFSPDVVGFARALRFGYLPLDCCDESLTDAATAAKLTRCFFCPASAIVRLVYQAVNTRGAMNPLVPFLAAEHDVGAYSIAKPLRVDAEGRPSDFGPRGTHSTRPSAANR